MRDEPGLEGVSFVLASLNSGGGKDAYQDVLADRDADVLRLLDSIREWHGINTTGVVALQELTSDDLTPDGRFPPLQELMGESAVVTYVPRVSAAWYPLGAKWGRTSLASDAGPLTEGLAVAGGSAEFGLLPWNKYLAFDRRSPLFYSRVIDLPSLEFAGSSANSSSAVRPFDGWSTSDIPSDLSVEGKVRYRPAYYKGNRDSDPRAVQAVLLGSTIRSVVSPALVLLNVHLSTLRAENRFGESSHLETKTGTLPRVERVPTTEAQFLRLSQLSVAASYIGDVYRDLQLPVVVVGDFNAEADSPEVQWFCREAGLEPVLSSTRCWRCGTVQSSPVEVPVAASGARHLAMHLGDEAQALRRAGAPARLVNEVCVNEACREPRFTHKRNFRLIDNILMTSPAASRSRSLLSKLQAVAPRVDISNAYSDHAFLYSGIVVSKIRRSPDASPSFNPNSSATWKS